MEPGDAVHFDFRTAHGARGNLAASRRRVLSLRWVGDDVRYVERPARTSPPYPGHNMKPGQKLREDWFPVIFGADGRGHASGEAKSRGWMHKLTSVRAQSAILSRLTSCVNLAMS